MAGIGSCYHRAYGYGKWQSGQQQGEENDIMATTNQLFHIVQAVVGLSAMMAVAVQQDSNSNKITSGQF